MKYIFSLPLFIFFSGTNHKDLILDGDNDGNSDVFNVPLPHDKPNDECK